MNTGRPVSILLVEDDDAHAEIATRNLGIARMANRIVRLADGQAALDYLFHEGDYASPDVAPRPDLVLLDLRLPRVDGLEVMRRVKAEPALRSIPIVVLTTSSADADVVSAYDLGAASYLVKPVEFQPFAQLMEGFGFYWLAWNQFPYDESSTW